MKSTRATKNDNINHSIQKERTLTSHKRAHEAFLLCSLEFGMETLYIMQNNTFNRKKKKKTKIKYSSNNKNTKKESQTSFLVLLLLLFISQNGIKSFINKITLLFLVVVDVDIFF